MEWNKRGGLMDEEERGPQDTHSLDSTSSDGLALRSRSSFRQQLQQFLRSTRCQVVVVVLVVLDTLLVITELLLDLEMEGKPSSAPFILHTLSLSLLALFLLEIVLKIYAYRFDFFTRKGDVFDAIVVVVAVCLDAVYLHSRDAHSGAGLIVVFRLWRIVRIQNAMVMQVRSSSDKRLLEERRNRQMVELEVEKYRSYVTHQDHYIRDLQRLLTSHSIPYNDYCTPPPDISTVKFVAEVNVK
ncbi:hypothetical protein Pmani_039182 [Petrolisthes manimaculis]|uniref:Voltage-gated hydrogen channel 1 n=1 Tax=Petrolisthes manimaculis TaxID=1843537 RepID=A0AAE1NCY8_9EUCA|nr:hypothetical protein Pmani_039182 [Petrolisthes manimaculis]